MKTQQAQVTISRQATKGSQKWMQLAVASCHKPLESALKAAVQRTMAPVSWRAPLAPDYKEPRDGSVFTLLEVQPKLRALDDFWPRRGPVWDGLATIDDQLVLIEAKAHIPELMSGPTKAEGASKVKIDAALASARRALAPRSKSDWSASPFFQYANRLAFLRYMRDDNQLPAHLAFVYFTNDLGMNGPESEREWRGAIRLMEATLGLGAHRLSPYVHKIFLDCNKLRASSA